MLILNPFAPQMPAWQRLSYIEVCHKLALYECLLSWADWVESEWGKSLIRYPFANGPSGLWVTLILERENLNARMRERDIFKLELFLDEDIARLANRLAVARGMPVRATWDAAGLDDLFDLLDLLRCEP